MNLPLLGRWVVFLGAGLVCLGLVLWAIGKAGIPFGKLPGDIAVEGQKASFYFPLGTSIAVSIFLTIVINIVLWLFRK